MVGSYKDIRFITTHYISKNSYNYDHPPKYISCKFYLTLTMSVSYLPIPNKGNVENDNARGHINCTCQLLSSDKLEVSKFRLSLFITMSNLATAKNTVPNNDAIPINNAYEFLNLYGNLRVL